GAQLVHRPDAAEAGDEQHDLHAVVVLANECPPPRLGLSDRELVRAVLLQPRRRLGLRQAERRVGLERTGDLLGRERVPLPVRGALLGRGFYGRGHRLCTLLLTLTLARGK